MSYFTNHLSVCIDVDYRKRQGYRVTTYVNGQGTRRERHESVESARESTLLTYRSYKSATKRHINWNV